MRPKIIIFIVLILCCNGAIAQSINTARSKYALFEQFLASGSEEKAYRALYQSYHEYSQVLDSPSQKNYHAEAKSALKTISPYLYKGAYYFSMLNSQDVTSRFAEAYVGLFIHPAMQDMGLQKGDNYIVFVQLAASSVWNRGDYSNAIPYLQHYLSTGDLKLREDAYVNLGQAFYRQKDFTNVEKYVREGLQQYPLDHKLLVLQKVLAMNNNRPTTPSVASPSSLAPTPTPTQPTQPTPPAPKPVSPPTPAVSDVDINIPVNPATNERTFALIIANEEYDCVSKVVYAHRDGEIFAEYCHKVLGLPKENVRTYYDVTSLKLKGAINDMKRIASKLKGNLNVIVYYAGHGMPDDATRAAYLLPKDALGYTTDGCMALNDLYDQLGSMRANNVCVFLDACFSGWTRDGESVNPLTRGVAIKPNPESARGNMIVFSATSDKETAMPYIDKQHGMFTYYLLKKLQTTRGQVTFKELRDYLDEQVGLRAQLVNHKPQTPTITIAPNLAGQWENMRLIH